MIDPLTDPSTSGGRFHRKAIIWGLVIAAIAALGTVGSCIADWGLHPTKPDPPFRPTVFEPIPPVLSDLSPEEPLPEEASPEVPDFEPEPPLVAETPPSRPWHAEAQPPDYPTRSSRLDPDPEPVAEGSVKREHTSVSGPPGIWIGDRVDVSDKAPPTPCRTRALRPVPRPKLPSEVLRSLASGSAVHCSVTVDGRGEATADCEPPSWDAEGFVARRVEEVLESTPWKPARDQEENPCAVTFIHNVRL